MSLTNKYLINEAQGGKIEKDATNMILKNSGIKVSNIHKKVKVDFILQKPLDERELVNMKKIDDIMDNLQKMYGKKAHISFNGMRRFTVEEV